MIRVLIFAVIALIGFRNGIFGQPGAQKVNRLPKGPNMEKFLVLNAALQDQELVHFMGGEREDFAPVDIWQNKLFYDKNEASQVFYYLPGSFNLSYDRKKGKYGMELLYPEDSSEKHRVTFKVIFESSVNKNAAFLLKRLAQIATGIGRLKVEPIPIKGKPIIDFPFTEFGIHHDYIFITEHSDYTKPMKVSWHLDQQQIEPFFVKMAQDLNFDGRITWSKDNYDWPTLNVHLSLMTPKTIGKFYYERPSKLLSNGFSNKSDFRLKINHIYVLHNGKSNRLILHKEDFPYLIVEPRSTFRGFTALQKSRLNRYANSELLVDYEILDCEECQQHAKTSIANYRTTGETDWIQVWDLGASEFTGAEAFFFKIDKLHQKVEIPAGAKVEQAFKAPKLLDGTIDYRYRLTIVLPDRTITSRYIQNEQNEYTIFLNKDFIKKHFRQFAHKN